MVGFPGCPLNIADGDTSQPSPYSTTEIKRKGEEKAAERKVEWRGEGGGKKRRRGAEKEGGN